MTATIIVGAAAATYGVLYLLMNVLFPKAPRIDAGTVDRAGMPSREYEQAKRAGYVA